MRETIEARMTDQTIELFHRSARVASYLRSPRTQRHTTIAERMPSAHRRYGAWTPTRLLREAATIGPSTIALVERILITKPHPEHGFRACMGILRPRSPRLPRQPIRAVSARAATIKGARRGPR